MTPDDATKRLAVLQAARTRLETSLTQKRTQLAVLRSDYSKLLEQAKLEFGVDSPEALAAHVDSLAAEAKSAGERLASALALYEQGNFAAATRVLDSAPPATPGDSK